MPASQPAPETGPANSAETRQPTANELEAVANLLDGVDAGDDEELDNGTEGEEAEATEGEGAETREAKPSPDTLDGLAERLGVEVGELYKVKVKLSDGQEAREVTLGELKDAMTESSSFEVDKLTWEEERTKREHELIKTQQTIADIVGMLPKAALTDELKSALARRRASMIEREKELTRSAIPDWADDEVEARDREAMGKHLEEYGFSPGYVDSIHDHKTLRYIRESMRREARINAALEQVRTARKPGHKSSATPTPGQGQRTPPRRRGVTRSRTSQVEQVVELLDGAGISA